MELKKKLQELRKELWDYLHDMQEWGIKDTVMENLDKEGDGILCPMAVIIKK